MKTYNEKKIGETKYPCVREDNGGLDEWVENQARVVLFVGVITVIFGLVILHYVLFGG